MTHARPTNLPAGLDWCGLCGEALHRSVPHKCKTFMGIPIDLVANKAKSAPKARNICALRHPHDSVGEATACGPVHAEAALYNLTVFIPGRPGIPCFKLPPDENGRPAYASVDWVLCDAAGKEVLGIDWKGATPKRLRYDRKSWPRTKRIFEAATGAKCVELKELGDIGAALRALDTHAAGAAGRQE